MDNLAANPGGSSIYGQPAQRTDGDTLSLVRQLKDREMQDFKDKAGFMSDLSLKQERMRSILNPDVQRERQLEQQFGQGSQGPSQQGMNTVMGKDPNQMTGYEQGQLGMKQKELGIQQQGLNLDSQKMTQQGKLGQEALDIKGQQEKLNQTKSEMQNSRLMADMQRKSDEANQRLQLSQQALEDRTKTAEERISLQKEAAIAAKAAFDANSAMKQAQFDATNKSHLDTIAQQQKTLDQNKHTKQTKTDNQGNTITTTTDKGDAAQTVNVVGKDGKTYSIPADKLDDWNANHAMQGEQ